MRTGHTGRRIGSQISILVQVNCADVTLPAKRMLSGNDHLQESVRQIKRVSDISTISNACLTHFVRLADLVGLQHVAT